MNGGPSWKVVGIVLTLVGGIAAAGWAIDARIDRKIESQLRPIREDVREIRRGVQRLVETQIGRQTRPYGE